MRPMSVDSHTNCIATARRAAPTARRRPISLRRSMTETSAVLETETAPITSETAARPSRSACISFSTPLRKLRRSEGLETERFSAPSGKTAVGAVSATLSAAPRSVRMKTSAAA